VEHCCGAVKVGDAAKSGTAWCWVAVRRRVVGLGCRPSRAWRARHGGSWRVKLAHGHSVVVAVCALLCVVQGVYMLKLGDETGS
jgi:hypothetical protein